MMCIIDYNNSISGFILNFQCTCIKWLDSVKVVSLTKVSISSKYICTSIIVSTKRSMNNYCTVVIHFFFQMFYCDPQQKEEIILEQLQHSSSDINDHINNLIIDKSDINNMIKKSVSLEDLDITLNLLDTTVSVSNIEIKEEFSLVESAEPTVSDACTFKKEELNVLDQNPEQLTRKVFSMY